MRLHKWGLEGGGFLAQRAHGKNLPSTMQVYNSRSRAVMQSRKAFVTLLSKFTKRVLDIHAEDKDMKLNPFVPRLPGKNAKLTSYENAVFTLIDLQPSEWALAFQ